MGTLGPKYIHWIHGPLEGTSVGCRDESFRGQFRVYGFRVQGLFRGLRDEHWFLDSSCIIHCALCRSGTWVKHLHALWGNKGSRRCGVCLRGHEAEVQLVEVCIQSVANYLEAQGT